MEEAKPLSARSEGTPDGERGLSRRAMKSAPGQDVLKEAVISPKEETFRPGGGKASPANRV